VLGIRLPSPREREGWEGEMKVAERGKIKVPGHKGKRCEANIDIVLREEIKV
jgi:hypothetical protein